MPVRLQAALGFLDVCLADSILRERSQHSAVYGNGVVSNDDSPWNTPPCALILFKVSGHPGVLADLVDRVPGLDVHVEYLLDQVPGWLGDRVVHLVLTVDYFLVEPVEVVGFLKGEITTEHGEEDDASRPDIHLEPLIGLPP